MIECQMIDILAAFPISTSSDKAGNEFSTHVANSVRTTTSQSNHISVGSSDQIKP